MEELAFSDPNVLKNFEFHQASNKSKILQMDTYGYCLQEDFWRNFDSIQQNFERKLFKKIYTSSPISPFTYFIRKGSDFVDSLNEFRTLVFTHGLRQKWKTDFVRSVFMRSRLYLKISKNSFASVSIDDFKMPLTLFACGLGVAIVVFACEGLTPTKKTIPTSNFNTCWDKISSQSTTMSYIPPKRSRT